LVFGPLLPSALSQTVVWDPAAGTSAWNTGSNWQGAAVPGTGDDVVIRANSDTSGAAASDLDASFSLNSITFAASGADINLSTSNASTITLTGTQGLKHPSSDHWGYDEREFYYHQHR